MKRVTVADALHRPATLPVALHDLAVVAGIGVRSEVALGAALEPGANLDQAIASLGETLGFETESVSIAVRDLTSALSRTAPSIAACRVGDDVGIVLLLRREGSDMVVLLDGRRRGVLAMDDLVRAFVEPRRRHHAETIAQWTASLPIPEAAKQRVADELFVELAGEAPIEGVWLVRPRVGAPLRRLLGGNGDVGRIALFLVVTVVQLLLALLGWSALFDAALTGALEPAVLERWVLLSISVAVVEILRNALASRVGVNVAALFKRRMLAAALRLPPDAIRTRGTGGILALISETESLEGAGFSAFVGAISALLSLLSATIVLARGAGGLLHVGLILTWTVFILVVSRRVFGETRSWVDRRNALSNQLVERMIGHRTRLVQELPERRHLREDIDVETHLHGSAKRDFMLRLFQGLPSRGWMVVSLLGLLPVLLEGTATPAGLLLAVGGMFQAQSAFAELSRLVGQAMDVSVAWQRAGAVFQRALASEEADYPRAGEVQLGDRHEPNRVDSSGVPRAQPAVLELRGVRYRYREQGEPVLAGVDLRIARGDRVLIEGRSGGGKSTLVAVMAGLREPDAGAVLHRGLDRITLGTSTWRRRIATVPQFHENHVFSGTVLYNVLLGRAWPPAPQDRAEAERVCRALGLGPLIDRMPLGLEQIVGETGWQLSHGERTRLFVARALLQARDAVLVDESFGALDAHTLQTAVDAAFFYAPTLVVVAHT